MRHNRGNLKATDTVMRAEMTKDTNIYRLKPYFLVRLTHSGLVQIRILWLTLATSESDLAAVVIVFMRRTPYIQQMPTITLTHERQQNRSLRVFRHIVDPACIRRALSAPADAPLNVVNAQLVQIVNHCCLLHAGDSRVQIIPPPTNHCQTAIV